jgi:hypothetical protein
MKFSAEILTNPKANPYPKELFALINNTDLYSNSTPKLLRFRVRINSNLSLNTLEK